MGLPKVKTATSLRSELYESLREVAQEGATHLVTHKQGQPVVMLSQEDYDALVEENRVLKKLAVGIADHQSGQTLSHADAKARLLAFAEQWK